MLKQARTSYWDPQNDSYNLNIVNPKLATRPLYDLFRVRRYRIVWWGHYADPSMLAAYALLQYLSIDAASNHPQYGPLMNPTTLHLMIKAQDIKEGRGSSGGCTLLSTCKVAKQQGWINDYYWATNVTAAVNYLHDVGPLLVSSRWYDSLNVRDSRSIAKIFPSAKEVQGSVYCVTGLFPRSGLVRIAQTGGDGYFFVNYDDFSRLISEGGEVALLRGLPASC